MPPINWSLARRVARPVAGELPVATRAEAHALVASLRLAAARAGGLVVETAGLPGVPARRVIVCDRDTWASGAGAMAGGVLDVLPMAQVGGRALRSLKAAGYGALAGMALGWVGRHILGQFDPSTSQLYLLAPNILHLQRERGFPMADLQLWVAAHEQTHALQFSAAPWLLDYLTQRFEKVAMDEVDALEVARNLARGQGFAAAMSSEPAGRAMQEVTAAMTLLEGHADFVSDQVGTKHIRSVRKLRAAFARTQRPSAVARLLPALDKDAQYRDGLRFCRGVSARARPRGLAAAFDRPENLPTHAEITDPAAWVRRVHGTA
ncbi:MAG: zinc-dependent metalloprotease [Propionibacteriaceae bacterium]|nr:zinc-dependent metalloprotease [Propionibacteriaceae bacterium]